MSTANAWAAGFFDGEGCVSIASGKQSGYGGVYYRVDLIVSNTDQRPLRVFKRLFGGRIDRRVREGNRRVAYQWRTTGSAHAAAVLHELEAWLVVKNEQAGVALMACSLLTMRGGKRSAAEVAQLRDLKEQMHALNRRGKPVCQVS